MKLMKEYDLFLPVNYNSGLPVELAKLMKVQGELIDKFHGLTIFRGACQGYWRDEQNQLIEDQHLVFRVIAESNAGVQDYMEELKLELEKLLGQDSIFIIVRSVEIL